MGEAAGSRRQMQREQAGAEEHPALEVPGSSRAGPVALLTGAEGSSKVPNLFKHVAQNYKALFPELPNLKAHINDSEIKIFHIPHTMKASSVPGFPLRSLLLLRWSPLHSFRVHSVTRRGTVKSSSPSPNGSASQGQVPHRPVPGFLVCKLGTEVEPVSQVLGHTTVQKAVIIMRNRLSLAACSGLAQSLTSHLPDT